MKTRRKSDSITSIYQVYLKFTKLTKSVTWGVQYLLYQRIKAYWNSLVHIADFQIYLKELRSVNIAGHNQY